MTAPGTEADPGAEPAAGVRKAPARRLGGSGDGDGPLLIVVGALHGNEPAGVEAARRVLASLDERGLVPRGRLEAFVGNRRALQHGVRFVDRDLNRLWLEEEGSAHASEHDEREDLRAALEGTIAAAGGSRRVVLLDLHSTSAHGAPFCILADTLQNRGLAARLGVPVILGLEERVEGTLLEWFSERGHVALCLEGGQHEAGTTVDHHESAIWLTLVTLGLLRAGEVADLGRHRDRLKRAGAGLPGFVEIRHRHGLLRGEAFEMEPGFTNFEPVEAGRLLATSDRAGGTAVRAPFTGLLLMPRYQGQGDDGFFLAAEVRRAWLRLSALLRRMGADRILRLLPGVRSSGERAGELVVNRRIARWLTVEVFHLLGYRRCRPDGSDLVFRRRVEGS